jgi:outer membrane protein OmpA-like peptidoglycan-associated protein
MLLRRLQVLALALTSTATFAQAPLPGFELERLELNPGAEGSLVVGVGELLPAQHFRLTSAMQYAHNPLLFVVDGKSLPLVGNRATAHLAAAFALTDWFQLGAQVPLLAFQRGDDLSEQGMGAPARYGLSTPVVSARLRLFAQDEQGGLDVAAEAGVGLPFGSKAGLGRDEGYRLAPKVMMGRHFGRLRAGLEFGYLRRPRVLLTEATGDLEDQIGDELRIGAALSTTGRRLRWELNVRGMVPLSEQPASFELLPGARYLVNPSFEMFALAGVGVGSAPGTPLFRLMVGGAFGSVTPRRGPGESSVRCELGLEQSLEECPEKDNDNDGIANGLDRCPTVAGAVERKGCPVQDTDVDGIEDALDQCPTENGPAGRQGCPVRDLDQDGTEDELDACLQEKGPPENRGCPVRDHDKDGIENDKDACPNEAGPAEREGCPETDTDKDSVPNRIDSCANEAGTYENQGCPQHIMPLVVLHASRLELRGKVYFEPSQMRIQAARSYELLDWVAKVIIEHPEFPLIAIGAHTDDRGFPDANRRLSQGRAEAVRQYLISKNVPVERLEAYGYGQERPIDDNGTAVGRENNRRVEFLIVDPSNETQRSPQR